MVELKTDGNTEALSFAPGDHVGIFPENSPELVDGILKHLPDAPPVNQSLHLESLSHSSHGNSLISVIICKYSWEVFLLGPKIQAYSFYASVLWCLSEEKRWQTDERIPACTLVQALTYFLDVTTPPSQSLLRKLSTVTSQEEDRKRLEALASVIALHSSFIGI